MNSNLPQSPHVPVDKLSAAFNKTTNSYKFYWFLSILDLLKETRSPILSTNDVYADIVALTWFPVNYYRLSFGLQDGLAKIILSMRNSYTLSQSLKRQEVRQFALKNPGIINEISGVLDRYVKFRFISHWFSSELQGTLDAQKNQIIKNLSNSCFADSNYLPLYKIQENYIEINPLWYDYLMINWKIIYDFTLWNLLLYVQKNNPNVPNVSTKLFEPSERNLLHARKILLLILQSIPDLRCIYSGELLPLNFSVDHFLPWSFVAHDQLWNLVPTSQSINSRKSDKLPDLEKYFERFAQFQFDIIRTLFAAEKSKALEDYHQIAPVEKIQTFTLEEFTNKLRIVIEPQYQIAKNIGFELWNY